MGATVTPELKKAFADRGVEVIPIPVGTKMLVDELTAPDQATQIVVVRGWLKRLPSSQPSILSPRSPVEFEAANPFLNDHRVGPHAMLPTACAISWLGHSCEQLIPLIALSILKRCAFSRELWDDKLAEEYVLDLQEIAKPSPDEIIFEGKIWSYEPADRPNTVSLFNESLFGTAAE